MALKYKKETLEQREAFEYYYALGADRTLEQVATKYDVTSRTVCNWSASFNWQEQVQQRDIEVSKKLAEKTVKDIVKAKANYQKIINYAIAKFAERLEAGNISIKDFRELVNVGKFHMALMGEAGEVVSTLGSVQLTEADREALDKLSKSIGADIKAAMDENEEE